jgi:flagellar export protein FliJ
MATKGFQRQRLLDVKDIMLQLEAVELKDKKDKHLNHRRALAAAEETKVEHISGRGGEQFTNRPQGPFNFLINGWYTAQLSEDIQRHGLETQEAAEAVEQQRKIVEEAARAKQTLEKLKEHQNEAARLDRERDDQKALDEVAARNFIESSRGRAV